MAGTAIRVSFTVEEVSMVRQLLDIALKAGGRQVVGAFVHVDNKFAEALTAKAQAESEEASIDGN